MAVLPHRAGGDFNPCYLPDRNSPSREFTAHACVRVKFPYVARYASTKEEEDTTREERERAGKSEKAGNICHDFIIWGDGRARPRVRAYLVAAFCFLDRIYAPLFSATHL